MQDGEPIRPQTVTGWVIVDPDGTIGKGFADEQSARYHLGRDQKGTYRTALLERRLELGYLIVKGNYVLDGEE